MRTVSIITLGCKVNQYESLGLASELEKKGYTVNIGLIPADVFVLNTCAVTNESERKSRGLITKVLKLNPNAKVYVCGCSSQNNPQKFAEREGVVSVIGTANKMRLVEMIEKDMQIIDNKMIDDYDEVYHPIRNRTRSYIKIQDGCNNFCSYCLIPYVRGRERSRKLEDIKAEIDELEKVTKEVVLTGINMTNYGSDWNYEKTLEDVVKLFAGKSVRFRISSLEAKIISDEFLKTLKGLPNFCPHFHLSMQSGSNAVLRDMNRHYTKEEFLEKVQLIRKYFPHAGITTDVIVGFPTETEECFEETMQTVEKAHFTEMHIFPYSPRNGTVALRLKCVAKNVPERVKKITELATKMRTEFIESEKGQELSVLVEEIIDDYAVGHSKNYIKCYIENGKNIAPDSVVKVKIDKPYADGAKVKLC